MRYLFNCKVTIIFFKVDLHFIDGLTERGLWWLIPSKTTRYQSITQLITAFLCLHTQIFYNGLLLPENILLKNLVEICLDI